jgi:NAD(P)-dependent dehydrogenase (short-subunit alcohol dehydrogenase family)
VLVTGGTRGIGAAVVRRFQLAGARVATTARSAPADPVDGAVLDALHRRPDREVEPRLSAVQAAIGDDVTPAGTSYHIDSLLTY